SGRVLVLSHDPAAFLFSADSSFRQPSAVGPLLSDPFAFPASVVFILRRFISRGTFSPLVRRFSRQPNRKKDHRPEQRHRPYNPEQNTHAAGPHSHPLGISKYDHHSQTDRYQHGRQILIHPLPVLLCDFYRSRVPDPRKTKHDG